MVTLSFVRWDHSELVWENELVIVGGLENMEDRTGTADVFSINFNDLEIKPVGEASKNFGLIFGLLFMFLSLLLLGIGKEKNILHWTYDFPFRILFTS